jgi:Family of unknown function (DUF6011)
MNENEFDAEIARKDREDSEHAAEEKRARDLVTNRLVRCACGGTIIPGDDAGTCEACSAVYSVGDVLHLERDARDEEAAKLAEDLEALADLGVTTSGAEITDGLKRHEVRADRLADFVLGGRCIFTLQNAENGKRFTYRLEKWTPKDGQQPSAVPFNVSVLTGSDNLRDYSLAGTWFPEGGNNAEGEYRHYDGTWGKKHYVSRISADAPSVHGIFWLLNRLAAGRTVSAPMQVFHEGRCGRCGRALTVPESIETGLGPVCAAKGWE